MAACFYFIEERFMKMSEHFPYAFQVEHNKSFEVQDATWYSYGEKYESDGDQDSAIEHAVLNHDRMADEIAELRARITKKDEMVSDLIEALGVSADETSELRDKHSKMSNEIAELCEALGAVNEIALLIASDIYEDSLLHDNVKLLIDIHK